MLRLSIVDSSRENEVGMLMFFFSSRRRHTRCLSDWSSDVCSSDLLARLLTGTEDAQWVEVEGVVHSVVESGSNVIIGMAIGDGPLTATTVKQNGVDYAGWVDAKVRIHGNAGALSTSRHQMTGFRVMFPSRDEVKIEEPAP